MSWRRVGAAGDAWRLGVTVGERLEYRLAAADILQEPALNSSDIVNVMDGHLRAIYFESSSPLILVS